MSHYSSKASSAYAESSIASGFVHVEDAEAALWKLQRHLSSFDPFVLKKRQTIYGLHIERIMS